MRWASLLFCCLFLALTLAAASAPLLAADVGPPREAYPDAPPESDRATAEKVADFCYSQRQICRKICYLRFRDDLVGCPQTCESREARCTRTACYKWTEPEFLVAERFGGYQCYQ